MINLPNYMNNNLMILQENTLIYSPEHTIDKKKRYNVTILNSELFPCKTYSFRYDSVMTLDTLIEWINKQTLYSITDKKITNIYSGVRRRRIHKKYLERFQKSFYRNNNTEYIYILDYNMTR